MSDKKKAAPKPAPKKKAPAATALDDLIKAKAKMDKELEKAGKTPVAVKKQARAIDAAIKTFV